VIHDLPFHALLHSLPDSAAFRQRTQGTAAVTSDLQMKSETTMKPPRTVQERDVSSPADDAAGSL
jgi:hypothetical protein